MAASKGNKTRPTDADVTAFLDAVEPAGRREDAWIMRDLMQAITGHPPVLWGSLVCLGCLRWSVG